MQRDVANIETAYVILCGHYCCQLNVSKCCKHSAHSLMYDLYVIGKMIFSKVNKY